MRPQLVNRIRVVVVSHSTLLVYLFISYIHKVETHHDVYCVSVFLCCSGPSKGKI